VGQTCVPHFHQHMDLVEGTRATFLQCTDLVCEAVRDKEAVAAEASEMQGGSCLGPDHLMCGVTAAAAVAC
jgi:hypothetical protein